MAGVDYIEKRGTLVFNIGEHRQTIAVGLIDDSARRGAQASAGTLVGKLTPTAPNYSQWLPTTPDSSLRVQTHAVVV